GLFARREPVPGQQLAEDDAECIVGELEIGVVPFEVGAGEESTVEKRDASEGACCCGPCAGRRIECAEEQWEEDFAMVQTTAFHGAGETILEESAIVVEPAFGLEEAEEEEAGDIQQSEVAAFGSWDAFGGSGEGGGIGEVGDYEFEGPIEPS